MGIKKYLCRDAGIISLGHFVWSVLCAVLVFSLLGVAHHAHRINLDNLLDPAGADLFLKITGRDLWLVGVTLSESALSTLEFPWLWSGLLFALVTSKKSPILFLFLIVFFCFLQVTLAVSASLSASFETLSACVVDEWTSLRQYKPAIAFTMLAVAFLLNLIMATEVKLKFAFSKPCFI